jgi:hypothetical protein
MSLRLRFRLGGGLEEGWVLVPVVELELELELLLIVGGEGEVVRSV